jgi:thioesterase domain-containing protein/acyl carrier protein
MNNQNMDAHDEVIHKQSRVSLGLNNEFVEPSTKDEREISQIFCEIFNLDRVGIDDDFFDLGGDSLMVTNLALMLVERKGLNFKPGQITEYSSVRQIAALCSDGNVTDTPGNIVVAQAGSDKPPLFVVHGQNGISFLRPDFLSGFNKSQPVYSFQIPGYDGQDEPLNSVEAIAGNYLDGMLRMQPAGPWFIAAYCAGSWILAEMIRQMAQQGIVPDRAIMLDPFLSPEKRRKLRFYEKTRLFEKLKLLTSYKRHQRNQLGKMLDRRLKDLPDGEDSEQANSLRLIYQSESAAIASAKLKIAFMRYRPKRVDYTLDMIMSKERGGYLESSESDIGRVLPNCRVHISGESHAETIGARGPENARIIQEIIDSAFAEKTAVIA